MDFEIEASNERFDPHDDRWLAQVTQLVAELNRDAAPVTTRSEPESGKKGGPATIMLALSSAGMLSATVEVIKAFVSRDRGRSVRVSWREEGRLEAIELSGLGIDVADVERLHRALAHEQGAPG